MKLIGALTLLIAAVSGVAGSQTPFEPGATPTTIVRSPSDSAAASDSSARKGIPRGGSSIIESRPTPSQNPGCPLSPTQLGAVRAGVGTGFIAGNAYLYHYFKKAWWSGERAPHFFFHADWDQEFRDQDKFGHMLGGYHLARIGYAGLREACVSDKKAIVWSAAYAALFQLQIEIFDGQFKKYGFSYADMIANTTGQALAVMQEIHPSWRAIKPTFSYHQTRALKNNIPGSELRPSLDYSGQTYWFSADMSQLLPSGASQYWPSFIRLSAGHSITDWKNPTSGATQRAQRKILLSLDFDPEKLPGNAPLWRTIKHTLSYYHFPAPALELTPRLHVSPWYR